MEELVALGSYFSGNIPEDSDEFEREVRRGRTQDTEEERQTSKG